MRRTRRHRRLALALVAFAVLACAIAVVAFRQDRVKAYWLRRALAQGGPFPALTITYPFDDAVFPSEIVAPVFRWAHPESSTHAWLLTVRFDRSQTRFEHFVHSPTWRPSPQEWEVMKRLSVEGKAHVSVAGRGVRDGDDVLFGARSR